MIFIFSRLIYVLHNVPTNTSELRLTYSIIKDDISLLNELLLIVAQADAASDLRRKRLTVSHPFCTNILQISCIPFLCTHVLILLSLIYESWTTVLSSTPTAAPRRYAFVTQPPTILL